MKGIQRSSLLTVLIPLLAGAATALAEEVKPLPRYTSVIPQILYRSGSPGEEGMDWLCQAGFRRVYSIYGARTTQHGPKNEAMLAQGYDERTCQGPDGRSRKLEWKSAAVRGRVPMILKAVHEAIQNPKDGPILVHCWGGRHYSVLITTLALRQFCDYSTEAAVEYLNEAAGNAHRFPQLQQRVESFKPLARLKLTKEQKKKFCKSAIPDQWARALEFKPAKSTKPAKCTWFAGGLAWRRFTGP